MIVTTAAKSTRPQPIDEIRAEDLWRLTDEAPSLAKKAMELTDSWGEAMFVMDRETVEKLFATLGFSAEVVSGVYEGVRGIGYVQHDRQNLPTTSQFTYHALDAACMVLRGIPDLDTAMASVDDQNADLFIENGRDLFHRVMDALPSYCQNLMFSPEVAARVVGSFGGRVAPDTLYDLAWKFGGQVTRDSEGRRGISTQFIRAFTLTIAATI